MATSAKRSRFILVTAVGLLIAAALAGAFWPRPVLVDLGAVTRGAMRVTIDEEGRTRVSEPYVVSTPVAGRLLRVGVTPGERVVRGETVIAHMRPTNPSALDVRTREQAQAAVAAAEAALRVALADQNAAIANRDLAEADLKRASRLARSEITSEAALERARQNFRVAEAAVETARAAIAMREAELANARALLIGFDDRTVAGNANGSTDIPLHAPADGRILRVIQQSETILPAGAPIMEIGDVDDDLEVVVELISSDAVQVETGDPVRIEDWGGQGVLEGTVARIDPFAVTKVSALGVEEQRVPVTITLTSPPEARRGLGHGYRVEARIVTWQAEDTVLVPASALFREGEGWAAFAAQDERAVKRVVRVGQTNGVTAQVLDGLEPGMQVVLYPSAAVRDGTAIAPRVVE